MYIHIYTSHIYIYIYIYIYITMGPSVKKSLLLVPWFHSEGRGNWEAILLGLNCTP